MLFFCNFLMPYFRFAVEVDCLYLTNFPASVSVQFNLNCLMHCYRLHV